LASDTVLRGIQAVVFDMDGTLIDSEGYTEQSVRDLLARRRLPDADLDYEQFHGITWGQVEALLVERYPVLAGEPLVPLLQERFHRLLVETRPPLIPGAREAVTAASGTLPTALASSSDRRDVEHVMGQLGLLPRFRLTICSEDCTRPKPDPQCYLLAAEGLGQPPERCLAFEDSRAGLQAARAAGMSTVAISGEKGIADLCIADYTELPPGFFDTIKGLGSA
jgi:HAD superfamily hydrolase (TIGR01509 family)